MALLAELGYTVRTPNIVQRLVQRLASMRPIAWLFQKTLYPIDRLLYRKSGGRITVPGIMAGLPVIMLTTTGARSGQPRTMPLLGIPLGDAIAVIGTNYGQKPTPGWVFNLRADPTATVEYRERSAEVVSRLATKSETEEAFALATKVYPGFAKYRERIDGREVPVFVLDT
ncbi:MAG: nitroreductase/quinone reductase family protein [Actinomycetota bacterium]